MLPYEADPNIAELQPISLSDSIFSLFVEILLVLVCISLYLPSFSYPSSSSEKDRYYDF